MIMKKCSLIKTSGVLLALAFVVFMGSCKKLEPGVIENNYSGTVSVTSTGTDPAGDFTGDGDSGTYSFAYENNSKTCTGTFDITSPTGSVRMVIEDKKGKTVLDETLIAGVGDDSFSGVSSEGKKGVWKVTLTLTNFDGDGSYSVHPGN